MAVDLHQGHVVLPHLPDWQGGVSWARSWDTRVETAEDGTEHRQGLRPKPRHSLRFTLRSVNQAEFNRLLARLREASRTGLVAVPFWGRALRLTTDASGTGVSVEASAWPLVGGDALFFRLPGVEAFEAWELARIETVIDRTITLSASLSRTYPAGGYCWPLLLGEYRGKDIDLHTDWHGSVSCEVIQLALAPDLLPGDDLCFETGSCERWNSYPPGPMFTYYSPSESHTAAIAPVTCWGSFWLGKSFIGIGGNEPWIAAEVATYCGPAAFTGGSEIVGDAHLPWLGSWTLDPWPPYGTLETFESMPPGSWGSPASVSGLDLPFTPHVITGWASPPWLGNTF